MEFELLEIKGVKAPKLNEAEDGMRMRVSIKVGVVGMPEGDKYSQFIAEFREYYSWDLSITTDAALLGLEEFGENYVTENYPSI